MKRTATRVAVLGLAATVLTLTAPPATTARPADAAQRPATTRIVLNISGCDGCSLAAHSYVDGSQDVWSSKGATVRDGRAVLKVPTARTAGMTVALTAPWEKRVGAVGQLVFRYGGHRAGDKVTTAAAKDAKRGSACFAGTEARRLTLKVKVYRAHFPGTGGRAVAPAAYTVTTQRATGPVDRVYDGFYGAQDVVPCG